MLYLLNLKVNGYKLLKDNFSIDFIPKESVLEDEKELIEIEKGFYVFKVFSFVGKNSSGKSSVLSLISKILIFLETGRWEFIPTEFRKDKIQISIIFYFNGFIYKYQFIVLKIEHFKLNSGNRYSPISNEKLFELKYDHFYNLDTFDNAKDISELFQMSLNDNSAIIKLTANHMDVDIISDHYDFNYILNSVSTNIRNSIIKLFDDTIEYINCKNDLFIRFKRFNEDDKILSFNELKLVLSSGTIKGIILFIKAFNALKYGRVLIVDDIETYLEKSLIYNLLFFFNDPLINLKGAELFYSTHYIELLNYLNRRDSIFIMNKDSSGIFIHNLFDYNYNNNESLSNLFDNNMFNTLANYNLVLDLRKNIIAELKN